MINKISELKSGDYVYVMFIDRKLHPNQLYSNSPKFYPILSEIVYDKIEVSNEVYCVKVTSITKNDRDERFYAYYENGTLFTHTKGMDSYYVEKWYNGRIQVTATSREVCLEKTKEVLEQMKIVMTDNFNRDLKDIEKSLSSLPK